MTSVNSGPGRRLAAPPPAVRRPPSRGRGPRGWRWRSPAVRRGLGALAAIAQLTLLLASGAEAWRGRDASAHVEGAGTHLHYAHDEATCVACNVQTMHAQAAPPAATLPESAAPQVAAAELASTPPYSQDHPSNGSRAPPLVS
jgi:hypothetical protein